MWSDCAPRGAPPRDDLGSGVWERAGLRSWKGAAATRTQRKIAIRERTSTRGIHAYRSIARKVEGTGQGREPTRGVLEDEVKKEREKVNVWFQEEELRLYNNE